MDTIPTDFRFERAEKSRLVEAFSTLPNPYTSYEQFAHSVKEISNSNSVPNRFRARCEKRKTLDWADSPFFRIDNSPIDRYLPVLDPIDPVNAKRQFKTSFVAEGFLQLAALLLDQKAFSYINVNNGDIFPMLSLENTQSQKAVGPIHFHKDLANHYVRPDWVNILGLRAGGEEKVYTCFVKNVDVFARLNPSVIADLKQCEFHTPFDDLTLNKPVKILPGTFIGSANNHTLHNKEIPADANKAALRRRWLMKTVNAANLHRYRNHMLANNPRIVNG